MLIFDLVKGWNKWREENQGFKPDLQEAILSVAKVDKADFFEELKKQGCNEVEVFEEKYFVDETSRKNLWGCLPCF